MLGSRRIRGGRSRCPRSLRLLISLGASGWLAALALGEARAGTLHFTATAGPTGLGTNYSSLGYYGPGVAVADIDDDADLDLLVCDDGEGARLFRNLGDGTFADVSAAVGLGFAAALPPLSQRTFPAETDACSMMPVFVDTDNDGDRDLIVTGWNTWNRFFENVEGAFVERTHGSGLDHVGHGATAAVGDFDRDGLLDVYIANWGGYSKLFRNLGGNVWQDFSSAAGLYAGLAANPMPAWSAIWHYHDDDRWPDLYVGVDYGFPNLLYVNAAAGSFDEITTQAFPELLDPDRTIYDGNATMGQALGDYDHDGDMDLFVANSGTEDLYRREGPYYTNLLKDAAYVGPGGPLSSLRDSYVSWSCDWPDLDNDGWVDLLMVNGFIGHCDVSDPQDPFCLGLGPQRQPNRLWRNRGDGTFADVSASAGFNDDGWGRAGAVADFDRDGDLDVFVTNNGSAELPGIHKYYRNDSTGQGHWLTVRLTGVQSNREGIGARLRAKAGGTIHLRDKIASSGYLSQSNDQVHFGLGSATVVEKLWVDWPSGVTDLWLNVPVDQHLSLVEGTSWEVALPNRIEVSATEIRREGIAISWQVDASLDWTAFRIMRHGAEPFAGTLAELVAEVGRKQYEYVDYRAEPGQSYTYRVAGSLGGVWVESAPVTGGTLATALAPILSAPSPNPFNPRTSFRVLTRSASPAQLRIVDALGREVARLDVGGGAGWREVVWDGTDARGRGAASGVYRAVLDADGRRVGTSVTLAR